MRCYSLFSPDENTLTLHSEQRWPHGWWTVHYINLGCMYSWRQWFPWQEAASASVIDFLPSVSWKIAQSFFGRSLQDIRVFKRDHFATSLTFSRTAAESRSHRLSCKGMWPLCTDLLHVSICFIEYHKEAVLPKMPLHLPSIKLLQNARER